MLEWVLTGYGVVEIGFTGRMMFLEVVKVEIGELWRVEESESVVLRRVMVLESVFGGFEGGS